MTYPLSEPDPPAQFKPADSPGEVILVIHGGHHPSIATESYGIKPGSRGTVVMLTGRQAGMVIDDVVLFGRQSSQFKDKAGGDVVLCRIVKDGKKITYEPGSEYDKKVAQHWIDANGDALEDLRVAAVRNFHEQCERVEEGLRNGGRHNATETTAEPWPSS